MLKIVVPIGQLWNDAKFSTGGILQRYFMGLYPWKSHFISNLNHIKQSCILGEMAVGVSSGQNIGAPKCHDFLGPQDDGTGKSCRL